MRCSVKTGKRVLPALLALLAGPAMACAPVGEPSLTLSVTPGELAGPDRVLRVEAFSNDCVRVLRPGHWRAAGEYSAPADVALREVLGQARASRMPTAVDVARMQSDIAALQGARGEHFSVQDADVYELRWRDGSSEPEGLRVAAVFQYAERYPEVAGLAELAQLVAALQAQAERDDLAPLGAQP